MFGDPKRLAAAYFLMQGSLGLGWWAWLALDPGAVLLFWPEAVSKATFWALLPADAALFVSGSYWTAARLLRGRVAYDSALVVCGATAYATLFCFGMAIWADGPWLSAAVMALSLVGTSVAARLIRRTP